MSGCEYIPIIDLSQWKNASQNEEVLSQWNDAMSTFGFALITGHGLPVSLYEEVRTEALDFFGRSHEEKMKFNYGSYGNPEGGFTPLNAEVVANSMQDTTSKNAPDVVESFVLLPGKTYEDPLKGKASVIPHAPQLFTHLEGLLHRLHEISSEALGLPTDYFRPFYDSAHPHAVASGHAGYAMRLAHYPPQAAPTLPQQYRYGAHRDYGGFTILKADAADWRCEGAAGLEVWVEQSQQWIPVKIPEEIPTPNDILIVNAGDFIHRWTNNKWNSALHRVSNPVPGSEAARQSRLSIVFFSGPMDDAVIPVMEGVNGEARYPPVRFGDFFMAKINPTKMEISS